MTPSPHLATSNTATAQPCFFFELPPELRNRIYEYVVTLDEHIRIGYNDDLETTSKEWHYVQTGQIICSLSRSQWHSLYLNICLVNRQLFEEAGQIFWGENTFVFTSFTDALRFLRSKNGTTLSKIRNLGIVFSEEMDEAGIEIDQDMMKALTKFCTLVASKCHLRSLELGIHNDNTPGDTNPHLNPQTPPHKQIATWAHPLLQIHTLHRLRIYWEYKDLVHLPRTLQTAALLRSAMLQNSTTIPPNRGISVRSRHHLSHSNRRTPHRALKFEMHLTSTGKTLLPRERSTRVLPNAWCTACGRFATLPSCACGAKQTLDTCPTCNDVVHTSFCACGVEARGGVYTADPAGLAQVLNLEQVGPVGGRDVWDARKWGDGALHEYLSHGVTEGQFFEARALLEGGLRLELPGPLDGEDYAASDFGEGDSLLSLHDWDERMLEVLGGELGGTAPGELGGGGDASMGEEIPNCDGSEDGLLG
ncbi:hypothetical protein P153DRAFT_230004 [Dothidotthia symphoricarpi CBS 119687]|uniref:DUF7730 domain-containing protein n=1 Tax=Dothidotthia symphoricarpi CBS 119687 TaxID=1392245 RepID=A0A6A6AGN5_9PLEO|nr:uncharacterized protein P153DRAFT_230004 [Dothidotthia symphoricarpi CBS 119687]KAF2130057.1 hypothetical protein P153DRAFT_230004 [Dothidotthia symphoricarpi CBS 119687]